jgi:hypothetical protein
MHNRDLPDHANVSHRLSRLWWFVATSARSFLANHINGTAPPPYCG